MIGARKSLRDVLAGFIVILSPLAAQAGGKVTVCHQPPGDPGQARTISVGAAAVGAHLQHGDVLGECAAPCTADGGRCTNGAECCGQLCSDQGFCSSSCTAGGPELDQPACTFSAPCCPGYGSCIQGFCWTEQSCSLLGQACDDLAGVVCCFDDVCSDGTCVPPLQ